MHLLVLSTLCFTARRLAAPSLSMFDLTCPAMYVPLTFFYKSDTGESPEIISQRLKTSLSETLSRFYPPAGRIESIYIKCNNEGVVFSEARTDTLLSDFLRNLNTDSLEEFFYKKAEGESPETWPLMKVKVSFFRLGSGFAVCVGISHKICDAASLLIFIQGWAATRNNEAVTTPTFVGATIYPPTQSSLEPHTMVDTLVRGGKFVTNRFVFESSKIDELKHKAASESVMLPTRVEAIESLILRCATNASRSNSATPKSTLMIQAMDLRLRIPSDVLPRYVIGNLLSEFVLKKGAESAMETWPLMKVKVSFFGLGSGFAVCVGISHKICDAASLLIFIQGWAATRNNEAVTTPTFVGATIYPPTQSSLEPHTMVDTLVRGGKFVTNRFVFESSKIDELKHKAASESVMLPTRVEAIESLILRCATNASRSNSATPKSTLMIQAMDLRLRIPSDVLPRYVIGNLLSEFVLKKGAESAMEIGEIIADFRKAKEGINKMIEDNLQGYKTANTITTATLGQNLLKAMGSFMSESNLEIEAYSMSSWCKKPFYEVDFGWGTPVWMGPSTNSNNIACVVLMDAKDGEGVEAWVGVLEQDMILFVHDQDLLSYAILNPFVLI